MRALALNPVVMLTDYLHYSPAPGVALELILVGRACFRAGAKNGGMVTHLRFPFTPTYIPALPIGAGTEGDFTRRSRFKATFMVIAHLRGIGYLTLP